MTFTSGLILEGLLTLIVSVLFSIQLRRTLKVEGKVDAVSQKMTDLQGEMTGLVSQEQCEKNMLRCHQHYREAFIEPTAKAMTEITQSLKETTGEIIRTIKEDRTEFWRVIHTHSHEGLSPNSRVIRGKD